MAGGQGVAAGWDPPPPEPGLDPWAVLEVREGARPQVVQAAFTVLRELAANDEAGGARWLVRLNWARRVLLASRSPGAESDPG